MKIFIAGASGLVGSNCLQHFIEHGNEVVGTYYSYPTANTVFFDTLKVDNTNNYDIEAFQPDVIVHCGALTHVDYCEANETESYQKTVVSTNNIIAIAAKLNAKLVYISTDYVFDGEQGPYSETDSVNPLSVYAKHKLDAEQNVLIASAQNLVLRITNVYGVEERNKNFVSRIIAQCKAGEKLVLKLPQDQYATPVNAWDIARAMLLLIKDKADGIYHIASTDWMNRVELAYNILKYFPDANFDLEPMLTKDMKQAAARPLLGGLLKTKFSAKYPSFIFSTVDDFVRKHL